MFRLLVNRTDHGVPQPFGLLEKVKDVDLGERIAEIIRIRGGEIPCASQN